MRNDKFILKGHEAVSEPDLLTWAKWMEKSDRRVAREKVGDSEVSTVFLGLDHNFFGFDGPRQLFETLVFGGPFDQWMDRCETWEEAEKMHQKAVNFCRAGIGP